MWYQISQEDAYLLQGAISARVRELESIARNWNPGVRRHCREEISHLERLSRYLYDDGQPDIGKAVKHK